MSSHTPKEVWGFIGLGTLVVTLLTGIAGGVVFGLPALTVIMDNKQLSEALPLIADNFEEATAKLPNDTLVAGAFTNEGPVKLTNPETKAVSTAQLSVTDKGELVTFVGTLGAYSITVEGPTEDSTSFDYDSRTGVVTQK